MEVNMEFKRVDDFIEYPPLDISSSSRWVSYFREQFVYIQFNLPGTRKPDAIRELHIRFVEVLQSIKKCIHKLDKNQKDYIHILDLFYRLLFYTRDCRGGNGDRSASYVLIMAFYDVYPALAIYALHLFVQNSHKSILDELITASPCSAIGSWKDMIAMCDFLREYSKKGVDHALVDVCVEMVVNQLIADDATWKYSIRAMNPQYISNVAKWIPREHKKYDWLFTRLVVNWSKRIHPHILRTANTPDSCAKSLSKCKRLFRKQVAGLNKHLMTPETFMTQGKWDNIKCSQIPTSTYLKHFEKINTHLTNESSPTHLSRSNSEHIVEVDSRMNKTGYLPSYGKLVHHAIRILTDGCAPNEEYHNMSRDTLNYMWKRKMNQFEKNTFQLSMPILDVSINMMQSVPDTFYNAVGIAIAIASRSSLNCRIMAIASSPVWIQWKATDTFMEIVERVFETISPIQTSILQYNSAIQLLVKGLCGSSSTPRFIHQMHVVVISDFATSCYQMDILPVFTANRIEVSPSMIYWNVSTNANVDIAAETTKPRNYFLSGNSLHALQSIVGAGPVTSFEAAVITLDNPRYVAASTYLHSLCSSIGQ